MKNYFGEPTTAYTLFTWFFDQMKMCFSFRKPIFKDKATFHSRGGRYQVFVGWDADVEHWWQTKGSKYYTIIWKERSLRPYGIKCKLPLDNETAVVLKKRLRFHVRAEWKWRSYMFKSAIKSTIATLLRR
jgi:hypothetical protein